MKFILAIISAVCVCGCSDLKAKLPNGTIIEAKSFICKRTIGTLSISTNGTATLHNYNLDQVAGAQVLIESAVKGAVEGMK